MYHVAFPNADLISRAASAAYFDLQLVLLLSPFSLSADAIRSLDRDC
jgi:hypothetical protein